MVKKYRGVFAVVCTPFDEQEDLDEAALRRHLRYLVDQCGVHSIIPTGSTGEFAFLNEAERLRVMEIALDEINHKVPVISAPQPVRLVRPFDMRKMPSGLERMV